MRSTEAESPALGDDSLCRLPVLPLLLPLLLLGPSTEPAAEPSGLAKSSATPASRSLKSRTKDAADDMTSGAEERLLLLALEKAEADDEADEEDVDRFTSPS